MTFNTLEYRLHFQRQQAMKLHTSQLQLSVEVRRAAEEAEIIAKQNGYDLDVAVFFAGAPLSECLHKRNIPEAH